MNKNIDTEKKIYDICIIGGGASGLAAAITARREHPEQSVIILEKNETLAKKLRATGNGRCNITNTEAEGYLRVLSFFHEIGIATRAYPNGLVYPYSESANDVAKLLEDKVAEMCCAVITGASVTSLTKGDGRFSVVFDKRVDKITTSFDVEARSVILATGGKAGSGFGTTGDGYALAKSLGHSVTKPVPILTPVECAGQGCEHLSGIRAKCKVSLYKDETEEFAPASKVFEEDGEVQFTYYGLSGIVVFNMTRAMRLDGGASFADFAVDLNLFPAENVRPLLEDRRECAMRSESAERCETLLRTVLKEELTKCVMERAGIDLGAEIRSLGDAEIEDLAETIHALRFRPSGLRGWKDAQCTSGGVSLAEIDGATCESAIVPGLFITGELLDYDGPCGGYNLTNAWLTGIHAGAAAAERPVPAE